MSVASVYAGLVARVFSKSELEVSIPWRRGQAVASLVNRVNKRIVKLGYKEIAIYNEGFYHKPKGNGFTDRFLNLRLKFISPMVGEWEVIGIGKEGDQKAVTAREVTSVSEDCAHCKETLEDSAYFILKSNLDKVICVHSKCSHDFTHDNVSSTVDYIKLLWDLENKLSILFDDLDTDDTILDLTCYLAGVIWSTERHGWLGHTAAKETSSLSTAEHAFALWADKNLQQRERFQLEQRHIDVAREVVLWGKSLQGDGYRAKVAQLARTEGVDEHEMPTAASLFYLWKESHKEEFRAIQGHLSGIVGDRTKFNLRIESRNEKANQWGDFFIYVAKGPKGEHVLCRANKDQIMEEGETYTIIGTIASKENWSRLPITVLDRCRRVS